MTDNGDPPGEAVPDPEDAAVYQGAVPGVVERWPDLQTDIDELASDYRDRGWNVIEIHPGDVAALDPGTLDRWGLDVLVPDDELEAVEAAVDEGTFEQLDVFRTVDGPLVFLLVVARDDPTKQAVLIPAYYRLPDVAAVRSQAQAEGVIHIHLRPLTETPIITFSHEQPDLFFPDDD